MFLDILYVVLYKLLFFLISENKICICTYSYTLHVYISFKVFTDFFFFFYVTFTHTIATFLTFENCVLPKAKIVFPHSRWLRKHANFELNTQIVFRKRKSSQNCFSQFLQDPCLETKYVKQQNLFLKSRDTVALSLVLMLATCCAGAGLGKIFMLWIF